MAITTTDSFVQEKNSSTQNPIVRLYSIYFPGEWYPPNDAGNPSDYGEGLAWPNGFPVRFAEVIGDLANDISYNVLFGGVSYTPFPVNTSGFDQGSDGKINEVSLTVFNVDNIITNLVENPFLVGNNISNSCVAMVNGEMVNGIDPRTVNASPGDLGSPGSIAYDSLLAARASGLAYNTDVVAQYGQANATFTFAQTQEVGGQWQQLKVDTRDLLGGVVDIKTTFANFLDYWPEYSLVASYGTSEVEVVNSTPYRIGDIVITSSGATQATIVDIADDHVITLSNTIDGSVNDPLYIVNADADSESYLQDTFKIDQLESLSEYVANFSLVSWLQYFKIVTPKRKYYKNTCQWTYKGEECQYPGPGNLPIPGTNLTSNANPITLSNEVAPSEVRDACSKSFLACSLRNNIKHFGGFSGTGRTVPK